jgi:nicotinamidase-related amidase
MQALLIIDIQNDYFPGGRMEVEGAGQAADNAARLLARFRALGRPVVHVQHLSVRAGAGFLLPSTPGAEIHSSVAPLAGELVLQKNFPNAFRQTDLLPTLQQQGIGELIVAGMMTHMCIDTTVRAAFDLGFQVKLAHDACATRKLGFSGQEVAAAQVHAAFMAALGAVFCKVLATEEVLSTID